MSDIRLLIIDGTCFIMDGGVDGSIAYIYMIFRCSVSLGITSSRFYFKSNIQTIGYN